MAKVSRKITVDVPREHFFDVITDFTMYPKFLSAVEKAEVLERNQRNARVRFEAKVLKSFSYTLLLDWTPPTAMKWELVEGDFMKANKGSWKLKELRKGNQVCTEATYEIDIRLSPLVPGFAQKLLVQESLPLTLSEFKERAEKSLKKKPRQKKKSRSPKKR